MSERIIRKRNGSLTLKMKLQILQAADEKTKKKKQIAREFNIPKSTLSSIIKQRDRILKECASNNHVNFDRKRLRKGSWPNLEKALIIWLEKARLLNKPVTGIVVTEVAEVLAPTLGIENFRASSGWLERFKKRHSLYFKRPSAEDTNLVEVSLDNWADKLPLMIKSHYMDNIYSATKFHFKMDAECERWGNSLTVLVCSNMSGKDKVRLFVAGHKGYDACLQHVRTFPVDYEGSENGKITEDMFKKWISKLDMKFQAKNQKVLLFLDNCFSFFEPGNLSSIKLIFFPGQSTTILQPLANGPIQTLKQHYKLQQNERTQYSQDNGTKYQANILTTLHSLSYSWSAIAEPAIKAAFRNTGFVNSCLPKPDFNPISDITFDERVFDVIYDLQTVGSPVQKNTLPNSSDCIDFNRVVFPELTDDEEELSFEDELKHIVIEQPSSKDVFGALDTLKAFLSMQDNCHSKLDLLNEIEKTAVDALRQPVPDIPKWMQNDSVIDNVTPVMSTSRAPVSHRKVVKKKKKLSSKKAVPSTSFSMLMMPPDFQPLYADASENSHDSVGLDTPSPTAQTVLDLHNIVTRSPDTAPSAELLPCNAEVIVPDVTPSKFPSIHWIKREHCAAGSQN